MSVYSVYEDIQSTFNGEIITPEDSNYSQERKVWNDSVDRNPSCILKCRGVLDVASVVSSCHKHGVDVSVRGGGHNVNGSSVQDGAVLIDMSGMRGVHVYKDGNGEMLVHVEGGAQWRDLDRETSRYGMVCPGGLISTTGVAGLTLGGGIGWLSRRFGLACDSLVSVELVTCKGDIITASSKENPDLFWAMRGAGANYGIVTSFTFSLQNLKEIAYCILQYSSKKRYEVFAMYSRLIHTAPNSTSFYIFVESEKIIIIGVYTDSTSSSDQLYEKIAEITEPLFKLCPDGGEIEVKPYWHLQRLFDAGNASGKCYYWKSLYLDKLGSSGGNLSQIGEDTELKSFVDDIFDCLKTAPERTSVEFMHLGGAIRDHQSAFGNRNALLEMHSISVWNPPNLLRKDQSLSIHEQQIKVAQMKEEKKKIYSQWAQSFFDQMSKHTEITVGYANVSCDENISSNSLSNTELSEQKVRRSFGENFNKLLEIKEQYDPNNFFHYNHNITPKNSKVWKKTV